MRFAKGHGTENDFVILPDPDGEIELTPELAARLCDRRAGVGGDGVLRVVPDPATGGWFMDYRNADGSLAEMCGNGIRVFGRYLLDHGLVSAPEFTVATRGGTRLLRVEPDGVITVDMGAPLVVGPGRATLAGRALAGLAVSVGNPHLACVVDEPLDGFDLSRPPLLDAGLFPGGANLELVRFTRDAQVEMRVYERGSGQTRSCGTGAVAAAVAAADGSPGRWTVDVPGGRLWVTLDGATSLLSGPAVIVAEGELAPAWIKPADSRAAGRRAPSAASRSSSKSTPAVTGAGSSTRSARRR
jgi:diaminopimelate epimerase